MYIVLCLVGLHVCPGVILHDGVYCGEFCNVLFPGRGWSFLIWAWNYIHGFFLGGFVYIGFIKGKYSVDMKL